LDTDEIICCFTVSKNPLNPEIIPTDKKNITTIQIKTMHIFKNACHDLDADCFLAEIFGDDKFEELKLFLFIAIYNKNG